MKFRTTTGYSLIWTSPESPSKFVPGPISAGPEVSRQVIALQNEGFLRFSDSLMVWRSYNKHIQLQNGDYLNWLQSYNKHIQLQNGDYSKN